MSDVDTAKVVADLDDDPRVTVNEDGRKTVTLSTPVEVRGEKVLKVTFRQPKGRDWRESGQDAGELGKGFRLASSLSDLPMSVFDEMDGADALLCVTVAGTMGKKLGIGGT